MSEHANPETSVLNLTAQIVSAHVRNNSVPADALPALIQSIYQTLTSVTDVPSAPEAPVPAVAIKKSIFPDYIICLEDGKKLKMLKRHLKTSFNMTPEEYRIRWGLPSDYPMVAPNYATIRSSLAKKIGLGRKPGYNNAEPAAPAVRVMPARKARGANG